MIASGRLLFAKGAPLIYKIPGSIEAPGFPHNSIQILIDGKKFSEPSRGKEFSIELKTGIHTISAQSAEEKENISFNSIEIIVEEDGSFKCFEIVGQYKIEIPFVIFGKPSLSAQKLTFLQVIAKEKVTLFIFAMIILTVISQKLNQVANKIDLQSVPAVREVMERIDK